MTTTKSFASIAEAGAHYFNLGFHTIHESDRYAPYERTMQCGNTFVTIRKIGFLDVQAAEETV
jgi:hypothetical protein